MRTLYIVAWWLVGTTAMVWLERENTLTWGGLVRCIVCFGWLGPLLPVVVALVFLSEAAFWNKPVFPWRKQP